MHLLAQLGLFTDRNDRFPCAFIQLKEWNSYTFIYLKPEKGTPFRVKPTCWVAIIGGTPPPPPTLRQFFVAALTPIISPRYKVYPTPSVSIFFSFTRPLPTFGFVVVLSISFLQFHDQAAIQYPVKSMMVIVECSMGLYPQLAWPRWKWNNGNLAHF